MQKEGFIEIMDPPQKAIHEEKKINPVLDLVGKVVGYRHVLAWTSFIPFLETFDKLLQQKYQTAGSEWITTGGNKKTYPSHLTPEVADDFASKIGFAIVGLGN